MLTTRTGTLFQVLCKFGRTYPGITRTCSSKKGDGDEKLPATASEVKPTQVLNDNFELESFSPSEAINRSDKIKAIGGVPLNKDDYLPKDRPWDGNKPDSEILHPPPPPNFINFNPFECSINDDMTQTKDVDPTLLKYRYPQFMMPNDPFPDRERAPKLKGSFSDVVSHNPEVSLPIQTDVLVIGGGIIGASIAYMLKSKVHESVSITVLEKDPSYSKCSTTLSAGGIRQQFSLKENVQMSMFTSQFLRNSRENLKILDDYPPDFSFNLQGYLMMATEEGAERLLENNTTQVEEGAFVDILNRHQLAERFPWLNTEGIVLGSHGVQNEGWFDPWSLLFALKGKAEFLGANFLNGELLDFNVKTNHWSSGMIDDTNNPFDQVQYAIYRMPSGEERQIRFAHLVIAAGADSGEISKKLGIGVGNTGIRSIPLPVERRKRYVFVFHCPDGPELDMPFLCDPSGVYCRREGLGGNYICGKCPSEEDEPDPSNLDVDYSFFENEIWPVLAHRVKAFERIKIVGAWAGYYDYNYFDQNAIIGRHPYFDNVFWATGFSGHGIQMGPAVGRAFTEMITDNKYTTIDLSRLGWERILRRQPLVETNII